MLLLHCSNLGLLLEYLPLANLKMTPLFPAIVSGGHKNLNMHLSQLLRGDGVGGLGEGVAIVYT
jgi:hypothetical protein